MTIRGTLDRVAHWIGVLWAQIGLLILFLIILNFAAGLVDKELHNFHQTHHPPIEDAYHGVPWTAEYFRALRRMSVRWYPYIYWKSSPISSSYLNVDQQGDRATWNKRYQSNNRGRPLTVFTFGGSTMFGYGVRDDYTLASLLSKSLGEKTDYNVEVVNYGQLGYVSTQEILLLYQLLRQGLRPDIVIFYDGVNDTYSAYQAGIAGLPGNESSRLREFNLLGGNRPHRRRLYLTALSTFLFRTDIAKLGEFIQEEREPQEDRNSDEDLPRASAGVWEMLRYIAPPNPIHQGPDALEQDVVRIYLFNKQVAEMLGKQFGFRCLFYWQPDIYSKNKLSPFERNFLGDREVENLFLATHRLMAAAAPKNGVRDMSGIFNDKPETYLMDGWHPTESGNELIAENMAGDVGKILGEIDRGRGTKPGPMGAAPLPSR